jgi:hypothetical protein
LPGCLKKEKFGSQFSPFNGADTSLQIRNQTKTKCDLEAEIDQAPSASKKKYLSRAPFGQGLADGGCAIGPVRRFFNKFGSKIGKN